MERPLYRRLADQIEARIAGGRYPVGSQLPTEPVLEQEFGVSRITIRQALGLLKRRGILASRSGAGTVVRAGGEGTRSMTVSGSIRDLIYYAAGTRYTPLDRQSVVPPAAVAAALHLEEGAEAWRLRGLRGRPGEEDFGFEEVYIPLPLGQGVDNLDLGKATIFNRLAEVNGLQIAEVEQVITAVAASAAVARHLALTPRAPLLKVIRHYRIGDGATVEVAVSYYNPARFDYAMKLFPD